MAITGDALLITLRFTLWDQNCQTGQFYTPGGAAFITANCDGVAEAWWNDVKAAWRDLLSVGDTSARFVSVLCEEFNGLGGLGEFAIPTAESGGTRVVDPASSLMPPYCALGVRLTVPTRTTRPGQKRLPFMMETDVEGNVVGAGFITQAEAVAVVYSSTRTLGAPVALGTLTPKIVSRDPVTGSITAAQDVGGYVVNPYITSQVSRRRGHGS